jgi:hypothetical protein
MEYTTGTRFIVSQKFYKCEECGKSLPSPVKYFTRIEEYGDILTNKKGQSYRNKKYKRFHLDCALKLKDLNNYEKQMLAPFIMARCSTKHPLEGTNAVKVVSDQG